MTRTSSGRSTRSAIALASAAAIAVFGTLLPLSSAHATDRGHHRGDRYLATGRVIDVRPVYRRIAIREPSRDCRFIDRPHRGGYALRPGRHVDHRGNGFGGAVVGGIVGGTIGRGLAHDARRPERAAATIAGALVGSAVGREIGRDVGRHHRAPRGHGHRPFRHDPVRHCVQTVTTRYERRLVHYDVTYVFRGRTFHTTRVRDPGRFIEIDIRRPPRHR